MTSKPLIVCVIPARMASTRFPGKPMKRICGIPMVGHCYLRAKQCSEVDETYVATCDKEIFDYITSIGGKAVMTSTVHERASDRTAEAIDIIEASTQRAVDIVVMLQGDEPLDTPSMISDALGPMFLDETVNVVNLMGKIDNLDEFVDPNTVKVVVDNVGDAVYFSREPIPSRKKDGVDVPMLKQICVIPFRRDYLTWFNSATATPLEVAESIDMLRIIEHGGKVRMVETFEQSFGVDTSDDLILVETLMESDSLMKSYQCMADSQSG